MRTIAIRCVYLTALAGLGCSSEESGAKGKPDGGAPARDGGGGGAPSAPEGTRLKWQARDISIAAPGGLLQGVEVCVRGEASIPCVTTDAEGFFDLAGLPGDTVMDLTFEKDGYIPTLKTIETANIDVDNTGNPPVPLVPEGPAPTDFGFTVDYAKGVLGFFVIGPAEGGFGPLPGSVVTISPDEGNGPVYFGTSPSDYDVTATSTYSFGGNFYNLDEGEYELTVAAPPGNDCAGISFPMAGWGVPVSGKPAVRARVVPGYYTAEMGLFCTPSLGGAPEAGPPEAGSSEAGAPEAGPLDAGSD